MYFSNRWDGDSGSTDIRTGQRITRVIDGEADTPGMSVANVIGILASLGVFKGAPHPTYLAARCVSVDAQPHGDDPLLWTVTVEYEEPAPTYGPGGFLYPGDDPGGGGDGTLSTSNPEPEDRPPTLKITFRRQDYYPDQDLDGVKFETTAGDRFDNQPPVPRGRMVVEFTSYHALDAWSPAIGNAFFEKVNSGAWQGFAARTVAVIGLTAVLKVESGRLFWELAWAMEVSEQSFFDANNTVPAAAFTVAADRVRVPMYGYHAYLTANTPGTKYQILTPAPDQKPLASPAKLNVDGTVRAADLKPLCKDFRVRDQISFAGL